MIDVERNDPGAKSIARRMLLLFGFALLFASCVEAGSSVASSVDGHSLAFMIEHDGSVVYRVGRFMPGPVSVPSRDGRTASILVFSDSKLQRISPLWDVEARARVELRVASPGNTCQRSTDEGGRGLAVSRPEPDEVFNLVAEPSVRFEPGEPNPELLAQLELWLPLRSCDPGLTVRPFARDGQLFGRSIMLDMLRDPASSNELDIDLFTVRDVAHLDADTALVLFNHGLVELRRGERVEDLRVARYFARERLPLLGSAEAWALDSMAIRPANGTHPMRIFVSGSRGSVIPREFETIAAVLTYEPQRIEVSSATTALGNSGRAGIDARGRFFVPLSESATNHRKTIIFADPDAGDSPFSILEHEHDLKQVAATHSLDRPHAVLTHGLPGFEIGDLEAGRISVVLALPFPGTTLQRSGHSITSFDDGGRLTVSVGSEFGELAIWREGEQWRLVDRHFDDRYRSSSCSTAVDTCGEVTAPRELADVTVIEDSNGKRWFLGAHDNCPHLLATADDGCSTVLEVDPPFEIQESRTLTAMRGGLDGGSALVGGRGSLFVEISR